MCPSGRMPSSMPAALRSLVGVPLAQGFAPEVPVYVFLDAELIESLTCFG